MFPLSVDGDRVDECRTFRTAPLYFSVLLHVPRHSSRRARDRSPPPDHFPRLHGYGGAERSIELLAPELARHVRVVVLTGNARHRHNLTTNATRAGVRLRVFLSRSTMMT